jgi:asparagine N-glycosylation enzyme membrane subunit Stt3
MEEIGAIGTKKEEAISDMEIEKRKKKIIHFLKEKTNWIFYSVLSLILILSIYIRTLPMHINPATGKPKLWDITTNSWTLGPDLDPFLFLRWAKYIVEHGKLFVMDAMRSVPLSDICSGASCIPIDTSGEMKLLSYLIASLNNFLSIFSKNMTVTYAAIIFPVIMAVLTGIAFFLFTRKLFYKENQKTANIIALIATAFFVLIPSLLPRSIAGIPEKESAAFFFIFIGFYFFLEAFTSEKLKRGLIFGALAGISTGLLGLVWGGVDFLLLGISGGVLFYFFMGKIDKNKFYIFGIWLISFIAMAMPFSTRYSLGNLVSSSSTLIVFIVFLILAIDFLLFKKKIFNIDDKIKKKVKLPEPIVSFLIAITIGIIFSLIFSGGSFIVHLSEDIISSTVTPVGQDRFGSTVAENKQPYFITDWANEFGPIVFNIPLYFWMIIFGSIFLFFTLISSLHKKEKRILVGGYSLMLLGLVFSKYSSTSILDGKSFLSLLVYFGGVLLFLGSFGYIYYKRYKAGEVSIFGNFNFSYVLYFVILTLAIISARGAVRLIMLLGAVSPIAIAFLVVRMSQKYLHEKEDTNKLIIGIITIAILLASIFTIWTYYQSDKNMAENYAPNIYTQQWQKAMSWVRENTPVTAVFAHWWDYGYWVQSIGERSTILDGGNAIGYWNYFMGRLVLTGSNERAALDFLYAHNGTHLLIDSTDIGKYAAFSSIGSNQDYDRYSWIPNVLMDSTQTIETNNETNYIYPIGSPLDEDIILQQDSKEILLPRGKAAVAGIGTKEGKNGEIMQPTIFFVYNGNQYQMPLRYVYEKNKLYDFKTGLDAGIFVFPQLQQDSSGKLSINEKGAALYLSRRTIHSGIARYYLFNEPSNYFKLVHTEEDLVVEDLKKQGFNSGDFVYYNGIRGPIKIWEINYPSDIKLNETYLSTEYPEELTTANPGY